MLPHRQNWWSRERRASFFCVYHSSFPSSSLVVTYNITKSISKHFNSILLFTIMLSGQQNWWFRENRTFFFVFIISLFLHLSLMLLITQQNLYQNISIQSYWFPNASHVHRSHFQCSILHSITILFYILYNIQLFHISNF